MFANVRPFSKKFSEDKRSSLFCRIVGDEEKKRIITLTNQVWVEPFVTGVERKPSYRQVVRHISILALSNCCIKSFWLDVILTSMHYEIMLA